MNSRALLFWALVILFVGICCWWVFTFTFRPAVVCRVLPSDTTVATRHVAPAARAAALTTSPAATNIVTALGGIEAGQALSVLRNPGVRKVVKMLGRRYVVTGFVPSLGAHGREAMVFGAWVGGGVSQLLRWGLLDGYVAGFAAHPLSGKRRVWTRPCHDLKPGYSFSFTVHEGVLAGCFSAEPLGVLYVLPRLEQQLPVAALARDWEARSGPAEPADAFRALVKLPGRPHAAPVAVRGALQTVSPERIAATVQCATEPLKAFMPGLEQAPGSTLSLESASVALGGTPSLVLAASVQRVGRMLTAGAGGKKAANLWLQQQMQFAAEGAVYVFAGREAYCGRIMRMKVPSIGVALPLADGVAGKAALHRMLDSLNALYGWGLIATPDSRDARIRIIDSVRSGGLRKLGVDERPAVAVCGGWLIGLSNVAALRRMLAAPRADVEPGWAEQLGRHDATMRGWTDLDESADLFRKALAGYTLISLLQAGGGDATPRYDTPRIKAILDALAQFDQFAFWLDSDANTTTLRVEWVSPFF